MSGGDVLIMAPEGGAGLPPPPASSLDVLPKEEDRRTELAPEHASSGGSTVGASIPSSDTRGQPPRLREFRDSSTGGPGPMSGPSGELSSTRNTLDDNKRDQFSTPPLSRIRRSPPGSAPSEEAAALLLNFSAVHEPLPSPSAPTLGKPSAAPYPNTPPHESSSTISQAPILPSVAPSSPPGLPTPSAPSPEAQTKSTKRKRKPSSTNAAAGPSRQSSAELRSLPHSMGEDNTLIRCICGIEDDDGFTVQCDRCYAWQHAQCFGYPNVDAVPERYYCELCEPRPFDPAAARALQLRARQRIVPAGRPVEPPKRSRPKQPKRPRVDSGKEGGEATDDSRDPNGMAPPAKPKRKSHSGKPRSKHSETGSVKDAEEDDYFRIQPWELEFTPLKDNLIRGVTARHAVAALHREWVDGEEEPRRISKPSYHDSGLPSPTDTGVLRLSPDASLSPPEFTILSPPVPPVFLNGDDLDNLASPFYLRPVDDSPSSSCYLPLKYIEPANMGIYARPTIYGVFLSEPLPAGGFVGEYRGEVLDSASYRKDPINQYAALGLPKPYVHSIGPPVNLVLDARSYGNEMRFVRSGCHPNAVLRPIFFRTPDSSTPKLRFGIFAARDLGKNEEVILGWEWDDQHVVHTLRTLIDSTLTKSATKPAVVLAPKTVEHLTRKFDSILTNVFSTFQSCACNVNTDCAFAQMRRLVMGQAFHGVSGARARKRIDLGELIGAVRGWRKREVEEADAARKATRFRTSGEWEVWRQGPTKHSDDEDGKQSSRPQSEREATEAPEEDEQDEILESKDEEMDVDPAPAETVDDAVDEDAGPEATAVTSVEISVPESKESPAPVVDTMDVDEVEEEQPQASPAPVEDVAQLEAAVETPKPTAVSAPETHEDVEMAEPAAAAPSAAAPSTPADRQPLPSSSVLSSVPPEKTERESDDEDLTGNESDATTITVARSHFSGDSDNEQAKAEEEDFRQPSSRRRRVVSPAPESPKVTSKRKVTPKSTPHRNNSRETQPRRRKHVIESSDEDEAPEPVKTPVKSKARRPKASSDSEEDDMPQRKPTPRSKDRKVGRTERRKSKTIKDSDHEDEDLFKSKSRDESSPKPKAKDEDSPKIKAKDEDSPKIKAKDVDSAKSKAKAEVPKSQEDKEAKLPAPEPVEKPEPAKEDTEARARPATPEPTKEATPPPAKEPEPTKVPEPQTASPPKESTPKAKSPSPAEEVLPVQKEASPVPEAPTSAPKEPTPPPKEPTPPPKEPTPPPVAPKKVSLKDYLANHKIRKVSSRDADAKPEVKADEAPKDVPKPAAEAATEVPAESTSNRTQPSRLNLLEHLPSSRSTTNTPTGTPFTPTGPSAAGDGPRSTPAFVPRSDSRTDYFNSQPPPSSGTAPSTPAFVPRPSPNFVPRHPDGDAPEPSPSFVPRRQDNEFSPASSRPSLPQQTPPSKYHSLPEIPPVLSTRDAPPHHGHNFGHHRPPPTGPRHPPAGPRGAWGGPGPSGANAAGGPASPVNPARGPGGFAGRGGFGPPRGGGFYRGRGGPRGRGRGM